LARFFRDDDLISHYGSLGRIDSAAASEHIENEIALQPYLIQEGQDWLLSNDCAHERLAKREAEGPRANNP
jgi:hypothetical protein